MIKHLVIFTLAVFFTATSAWAEDWPHWRGSMENGVSMETNLPGSWSKEGENLLWSAPYGARTAPLVMNGRVYLINRAGEGVSLQERVMALDSQTGEVVWEHRFNVFHTDIVANRLGWANLAGDLQTGYVYAHGVQGLFFCFDKDGKVVWQRSLTEEFGRISGYGGRTNTPIVDGNLVILSFLSSGWGPHGPGKHRFVAMDKSTGEIVWWADPGDKPLDTTYAVPVVREINGVRMLIAACADGGVHGLKVHTGEKIWSFYLSKRGLNVSIIVDDWRVYACHSEENIDNNVLGRVVCIDARQKGDITKTGEVWRHDGIKAGYATPILYGDDLYVMDNSANIHCLDKNTGKEKWLHNYGTVAKGSGVYADGKIYVGEVGGRYYILEPGKDSCKVLDSEEFAFANGSPIEVNGSPAVAVGRVYLPTNEHIYCIGFKDHNTSKTTTQITATKAAPGKPAHLLVVPGETWIYAGESKQFAVQLFDDNGNMLATPAVVNWSIAGLSGKIDEQGVFTATGDEQQAGVVKASFGELSASARLRVLANLPYREDFESIEVGLPPAGWITSKLKCQVTEHEGGKVLRKLADRPAPPFARLKAYIQPPLAAGYTIQADLKGMRKRRLYPDMGLINARYTMILMGTTFRPQLRLVTYHPIPRLQKEIPFKWKTNSWYTAKLSVKLVDGKALVRGKVWPRGEEEPQQWTIEMVDPHPNDEGSPGLYAYSVGITEQSPGTEVFFDNLVIERDVEEK